MGRARCALTRARLAPLSRLPNARAAAAARATESSDAPRDDGADGAPVDGAPLVPRFLDIAGDADAVRAGVDALSAKEIKDELKHFGVAFAGKKDQIVERLVECYSLTVRALNPDPPTPSTQTLPVAFFIRRFFPSFIHHSFESHPLTRVLPLPPPTQAAGEDVVAAMRTRTMSKVKAVSEERAAAAARRDARRARAGVYEAVSDKTAKKLAASRRRAVAGAQGAGASGVTNSRRSRAAKLADIADVDIDADVLGEVGVGSGVDANDDDARENARYSMANPREDATRKTKLNVARRDLDRQADFQGAMNDVGWYMCEVPEGREQQAAEKIDAVAGTEKTEGEPLTTWVPRVPRDDFCVASSDAEGKTRIDLLRSVPAGGVDETLPFPGYVLVHAKLSQTTLNSLEEIYGVKGFASAGVTKYGSTRRQTGERPRPVPAMQLETMMKMCDVRVVSDAEHAKIAEALKRRREAEEKAAAMGTIPAADEGGVQDHETSQPARSSADVSAEPTVGEEATALRDAAIRPGAASIEVVAGPFKGFKGYVTSSDDKSDRGNGAVDAKLVIFGRETDVTLEAGEFETP